MSKVQGKDANLLNNLSGSEIANELDTRLRDLEKNIAVAREFIKLADESYSELRHKWNLLHEEVSNKRPTQSLEQTAITEETTEVQHQNKSHRKTKSKEFTELTEPKSTSSPVISTKPEDNAKRAKTRGQSKKDTEISSDGPDSFGSEKILEQNRDSSGKRRKVRGHK
jgi:predicted nuclease with TOPRIM domain